MTNLILSLMTLTALAAPVECFKTMQECKNKARSLSEEAKSGYVCQVDPNPDKCTADKTAEYEAQETAKYKARNGNQNPPVDYYNWSTSTFFGGIKTNQELNIWQRILGFFRGITSILRQIKL